MSGDALFDAGPPLPRLVDPLSATQRRTLRQRDSLARGVHPATGRRLLVEPADMTCGDCAHMVRITRNRTWLKCEHHRLGLSHSEASDIRKSWPACELFAPVENNDE